jgi:adenine-specific DNA-methyltransferase
LARKIGKPAAPTSVEAVHHTGDSRVNIPTAETQSLAAKEAQGPQTLRYPRDPSLDPQLVWKGKDEQDGEDLVVPAIPIYIQEQISPKPIIEDLRATTAAGRDSQLDLFSGDFNGMAFTDLSTSTGQGVGWTGVRVASCKPRRRLLGPRVRTSGIPKGSCPRRLQ